MGLAVEGVEVERVQRVVIVLGCTDGVVGTNGTPVLRVVRVALVVPGACYAMVVVGASGVVGG